MRFYDIIEKKKQGLALTREEIRETVRLYTDGSIPDYQMSALLMAIYFKGMTDAEASALTEAMLDSGDSVDLSELGEFTADKHSTGGVGDKLTLIVAPIAAVLGCKVAKMSGRGLGHTGGTIDKLESIPGFSCDMTKASFIKQANEIGAVVCGQTENLAPADKKLYALRDVTATVDSIPLIASSVMSKKLASGARSITLDVKCGEGAFMKDEKSATELARLMVEIGKAHGKSIRAFVTDMSFPLGYAVGNSLEVIEAIEVLKGGGPKTLRELSVALSASMASCTFGGDAEEWKKRASEAISSGRAYAKLLEIVKAQGGDTAVIENPELFEKAAFSKKAYAAKDGFVYSCDTEKIGTASMICGAGRANKGDTIDYTAGVLLKIKKGDLVKAGDVIAEVFSNKDSVLDGAVKIIEAAYGYSDEKPMENSVILTEIS